MKTVTVLLAVFIIGYTECKYREEEYRPQEGNHKYKKYYNEQDNQVTKYSHKHKKYRAESAPPDHNELIPMARYVLRNADWASIATISVESSIRDFPFSNVKSIVEGSKANSTGIPYFYMSPLDFTAKDLAKDNRATVLVSLEETKFCEQQNWDPEDPRCTRLMLSGKMKKLREDTPEYNFAKAALFERHPAMANYPPDHDWFVAKMKMVQIAMVDWFGGAKFISVKDYLAYNYTDSVPNYHKIRKHDVTPL